MKILDHYYVMLNNFSFKYSYFKAAVMWEKI